MRYYSYFRKHYFENTNKTNLIQYNKYYMTTIILDSKNTKKNELVAAESIM